VTHLVPVIRQPTPCALNPGPLSCLQDVLLLDVDFMVGGGAIADIANHPGVQAGAL
jgi:hypothetical protein